MSPHNDCCMPTAQKVCMISSAKSDPLSISAAGHKRSSCASRNPTKRKQHCVKLHSKAMYPPGLPCVHSYLGYLHTSPTFFTESSESSKPPIPPCRIFPPSPLWLPSLAPLSGSPLWLPFFAPACSQHWFRKKWNIAIPKNTFAALGQMPGSEGNHSQSAFVYPLRL